MVRPSLSVIIPAFNEAKNIGATCTEMARVVGRHIPDYEILVIDDASQDETGEVVRKLQKENSRIVLVRNPVNRGLGYNYREGIFKSRCRYAIMVPGDNELVAESLESVLREVGSSDVIICKSENPEVRPRWRQMISKVFTGVLNVLFGLRVRYYNGPSLIRTDLAREFVPSTSSFAYMAVILGQLLKAGATYKEMMFRLRPREFGKTKAFRPRNVINVVRDVTALFWKVQIRHRVRPIAARDLEPDFKSAPAEELGAGVGS